MTRLISDALEDVRRAARFGFLVSSERTVGGKLGWRRIEIGGLAIWSHPECSARELFGHGWSAVVLGEIYVAHGASSVEVLVERLAEAGDVSGLDRLGGRFAIVVSGPPGCRVFHDAFGSRSVYYRPGECFAASSHSSLLAHVFGDGVDESAVSYRESPEYSQRGTSYLPGDRTMYRGIYALIPNNYYDVDRQRTVRYWPRDPLQLGGVGEFYEACDEYFVRTSEFLHGRYTALLGLTGGVDARSLIAGLRWAGTEARFFTWKGGRVVQEELPLIEAISRHIGWPHTFVDIGRRTPEALEPSMRRVTALATGHSRGPSALTANMSQVVQRSDVFLRGYGGEIIRGFYNRHNRAIESRTPEELTSIYLTRRVVSPSRPFLNFAVEAFQGFLERANFGADFHGRDPLDIFYWEHRMGTWGSVMLNEMDPVVYSMAGLNSRTLYDVAFSIPASERLGTELMLDLVAHYDGQLAKVGVVS